MAKKNFKDIDLSGINPAYNFISTEEAPKERAVAPEGYKVNPLYIEKKNRRLQLLLQPSLYELIKDKAEKEGTSVNNFIHEILEKAVK